ncbi:MAG: ABC transporter ATP-binding protein [Rhodanobacter sp.]
MLSQDDSAPAGAPGAAPRSDGLLAELGQVGRAVRRLFGAQLHLLAAELGLASRAVSWMLLAGLAATVAGVGLGLSGLALVGLLLAKWFGSWLWAMLALCVLQAVFLLGAILLFRRCMHWMSLPATRQEWGALVNETLHHAERDAEAEVEHEVDAGAPSSHAADVAAKEQP